MNKKKILIKPFLCTNFAQCKKADLSEPKMSLRSKNKGDKL